ncbi:MFS transporter [Gryllotalpicola reticulitermitis]|uniref:MFS transporter n=1 Tax=Gryllotalpicola reticulitermitis TaxID=1184153 RepID=A0ABV8Q5Q2_9MICO
MTGERRVASDRRSWLYVCAAVFAIAWGGNEFTPLLGMYREADGLSPVTVDVLLAVYVLGIVPAMIVGAPLSDRFGRRPVMLPAAFIGAAGSLVLAFAGGGAPLLGVGRVLSGMALGLAMAVGTSWVKELSQAPYDAAAKPGGGAARGALSLTAGFLLGAAVAAPLAQWAPLPQTLPYLISAALCLAGGCLAFAAPETRRSRGRASVGRLARDLAVPAAGHRRFLFVVLPAVSWIFGSAASAYAVLPALLTGRVTHDRLVFSGLLCAVTLGAAFAVQPLARRFYSDRSARGVLIALGVTVVGMLGAAVAASALSPLLAIAAALVLGIANGLLLLSTMLEVQRIARDDDLAGLTALLYAGAYVGFFIPTLLGVLSGWVSYPVMFVGGAVIASGCFALVLRYSTSYLHRHRGAADASSGDGHHGDTRPLDLALSK